MSDLFELRLQGQETTARLPALLAPSARAAGRSDDLFLPPGYLVATRSFDVGVAARSSAGGATERSHTARADEVVVLELADGSTLITSAARLRDSLEQARPDLLGADGAVLLEKLRADGAATGRGFGEAVGGLISKVFTLVAGEVPDAILGDALGQLTDRAELGVSWAGTRALMWAIEKRLDREPGLYQWTGASGQAGDLVAPDARQWQAVTDAPAQHPLLVFVHGTASNTLGSFGDLRLADRDLWGALERRYRGGIFGFEHRTLSQSPIENALQLVRALPVGAHVSLVSHSRGGLVADLLCLGDFDGLVDAYRHDYPGTGDAAAREAARVKRELADAHATQRGQLRELAALLRERRLVVQRYVRAASPANGTLLASGNFDVFLSGLLTLIGQVPFFFGNPLYSAFKRVVIEIARHRTNPHLVPGIEAMLPDSPLARLLREAPLAGVAGASVPPLQMAVIAGDIEGGHLLKRLGVLLTDFLLFDNDDNDLVVNTTAMLAGVAPQAGARVLFDRGADVSHFRYFANLDTRAALRDWLTSEQPQALEMFRALPAPGEFDAALAAATRDVGGPDRPVVVVLPGVMGSHLHVGRDDRVWFDPLDIAAGGLAKVVWGQPDVEADTLFGMFYGRLCTELSSSHRVETFAYDWRQPLDVLAERFGEFLDRLLRQTKQPVRILAHSMGGLVVRATIHQRRPVMDTLMARDGARLVMLGTPHQGAHSMVENLLGKGDMLRTLARLDLRHDMQAVLDIVAGFRGALQLLPKPGFKDIFQGQSDGGELHDYQQAATWQAFRQQVRDPWFGDGKAGTPEQAVLDAASWLWRQDGLERPSLPSAYEAKSVYIGGVAPNTPCGVRTDERGRLKMVGTSRGDGTVTWESGRIGGIGRWYYMPVAHGDLTASPEHFGALVELLTTGATSQLATSPPAVRAIEEARPVSYDARPPTADDPDALQRLMLGGALRNRVPPRPKRRLEVTVKAMDLRFVDQPLMVGHYEQDPIAGPQALVDRELLAGDLSERHSLGLYAGPRGTAVVVLRVPGEQERLRGRVHGAVVTGLGAYDGALSLSNLTESVRAGALRYLLQIIDVLGKADREVSLATLLIGYNSSANLTIPASVEALVRGVTEANARFFETTRLNIRIARLDIVELYLDTAITAAYALRQLAPRLEAHAERQGARLVCRGELVRGDGVRQRLLDRGASVYWPRLIVTDADAGLPPMAGSGLPGAAAARAAAAPIADRLRFLYVGQRARAESVMQQRQPGLIEALVRQQIQHPVWQEDFGRMLFQLMTPPDFKDAARQLDRLVLVVDATTANLPWELMLADDPTRRDGDKRPLALRMAVVRQLASTSFRRQVRQAIARSALIVGNPSVRGFEQAFTDAQGGALPAPPALPGAQAEAEGVAALLGSMGYQHVEQAIGDGVNAAAVLGKLYQQPWRVLHISAHGVYGLPHVDGRVRSGVLLSDGLLITAAEIAAMEVVPELVFLNCCHLGQMDAAPGWQREGNKLAASVARELIEIGVRCVIVAGWAVNDAGAQRFGQVFYEQLLLARRTFGDAVFAAREAVWQADPQDITWGAFQAYGDPGWLAEPRADGRGTGTPARYVSPEEMLDDLARLRVDLSRQSDQLNARELRAQGDSVEAMIAQRCPPGWRQLPQLQSALGATWRDLGELDRAREAFVLAIQAEDQLGQVPIHDIEQLAQIEARLGEQQAEAAIARGTDLADAQAWIDLALRRLDGLDALVSAQPQSQADATVPWVPNSPRSAARGGAWKRKASLQARLLLRSAAEPRPDPALIDRQRVAMDDALVRSIDAYRAAEGQPGSAHFSPACALNRLALDALTAWSEPAARDAAIALARQCAAQEPPPGAARSVWEVLRGPQALLAERLLDGSLGRQDDTGQALFEAVLQAFGDALAHVAIKPQQIDSLASHLELLSRFFDAQSVAQHDDAAAHLTATRLQALAHRLHPGRAARSDRPGTPAPSRPRAPRVAPRPKPPAKAKPQARTKIQPEPQPKTGGPATRRKPKGSRT